MALFRKSYNFREDGIPNYQNRFSHLDRVIVTGKVTAREPEMNGGTTVAFLPYPDFDDPTKTKVLPDRNSAEQNDFNPWLFYADGVRKFGRTPITLLFDNPEPETGFNPMEHHPVHMIWNAVKRTVKTGISVETPFGSSESDKWAVLLDGDEPPGQRAVYPVITRPDTLYAAYACIYRSGTQEHQIPQGSARGELPIVFVMTRSTIQEFLREIDERIPGVDESKMESLKHPVITGAKYIHFFDRKKNDCPAKNNSLMAAAQSTQQFGGARRAPKQLDQQTQNTLGGYGVFVNDTLRGLANEQTQLPRDQIAAFAAKVVRPWNEVLRGHTPIECAQVIANYCGLPRSVLYHAWKTEAASFYPDELKVALRNPVSANFQVPPAPQQVAPPVMQPPIVRQTVTVATTSPQALPSRAFDTGDGGFGVPAQDLGVGAQAAVDPGAAPWGGHISDPPLRSGGALPPEDAVDAEAMRAINERFRQHLAGKANGTDVARSAAARGPN